MIIKNEDITVKLGDKEYHFKNLILNTYLDFYANRFMQNQNVGTLKAGISTCFIKFDEPLNFDETSVIYPSDFDIRMYNFDARFIANLNTYTQNGVNITTKFPYANSINNVQTDEAVKWSDFVGRRIMAIGFSPFFTNVFPMNAILDTSNFNLTIQQGQNVTITRTDEIKTNAIGTFSNKVKGVVHLGNVGMTNILPTNTYDDGSSINVSPSYSYAKLTGIGLGISPSKIIHKYNLNDVTMSKTGIGQVSISGITNVQGTEGLYPSNLTYPSITTFPSSPTMQYVIYEYKLYQQLYSGSNLVEVDTGEWYLQAYKFDKIGNLDIKINYERG